jgi:hypothetical protein
MEECRLFAQFQQCKRENRAMEKRHRQEACTMIKKLTHASTQWENALNDYLEKKMNEFNKLDGVDLTHLWCKDLYIEFDLDDVPMEKYMSFIFDQIVRLYHEQKEATMDAPRMWIRVGNPDIPYIRISIESTADQLSEIPDYYVSVHDVNEEHAMLTSTQGETKNLIPVLKRALRNVRHPSHSLILDGLYFVFNQFPRTLHDASDTRYGLWPDKAEQLNDRWMKEHASFEKAIWYEDLKTLFTTTHFIAMQYDYTDDYRNTMSPTFRYTDDLDNVYSIWIGKRQTRNHTCYMDKNS